MTGDPTANSEEPPTTLPIEVAVAVIVNSEGEEPQILAAWRDESHVRGGTWELPGGKVDLGETIQNAAVREAREELGITIETGEVLTSREDIDHSQVREHHVRVHAVIASLTGEEPSTSCSRTWRWIPISNLNDVPWPKANQYINQVIAQRLATDAPPKGQ